MNGAAVYQFADHALVWTHPVRGTTERAHLSPMQAAIFGTLVKRIERVVILDILLGEMYWQQDEPETPELCLKTQISYIRNKIKGSPVTIEGMRQLGYVAHGHVEIDWNGL